MEQDGLPPGGVASSPVAGCDGVRENEVCLSCSSQNAALRLASSPSWWSHRDRASALVASGPCDDSFLPSRSAKRRLRRQRTLNRASCTLPRDVLLNARPPTCVSIKENALPCATKTPDRVQYVVIEIPVPVRWNFPVFCGHGFYVDGYCDPALVMDIDSPTSPTGPSPIGAEFSMPASAFSPSEYSVAVPPLMAPSSSAPVPVAVVPPSSSPEPDTEPSPPALASDVPATAKQEVDNYQTEMDADVDLERSSFQSGDMVRVFGLSKVELNGMFGVVLSTPNMPSARLPVMLESGRQIAIKPANLQHRNFSDESDDESCNSEDREWMDECNDGLCEVDFDVWKLNRESRKSEKPM